jgi:hypothetical protein
MVQAPTTNILIKSRQIEHAIQTHNIWLLRSLALSPGGLCHGKLRCVWHILDDGSYIDIYIYIYV